MKLGILGGTFDPIHNAHLRLAIEAAEALDLDKVVMEVARLSPIKTACHAGEAERVEMARFAVEDDEVLEVGTIELLRSERSYTVDTIAEYAKNGGQLWFVLGADAVAELRHWKNPQRLLEMCRLAAAQRPGHVFDPGTLPEEWLRRIDLFDMSQMDISSSAIRDRVRAGRSIRGLVPDPVRHFIGEKRLYR